MLALAVLGGAGCEKDRPADQAEMMEGASRSTFGDGPALSVLVSKYFESETNEDISSEMSFRMVEGNWHYRRIDRYTGSHPEGQGARGSWKYQVCSEWKRATSALSTAAASTHESAVDCIANGDHALWKSLQADPLTTKADMSSGRCAASLPADAKH